MQPPEEHLQKRWWTSPDKAPVKNDSNQDIDQKNKLMENSKDQAATMEGNGRMFRVRTFLQPI